MVAVGIPKVAASDEAVVIISPRRRCAGAQAVVARALDRGPASLRGEDLN
jgi:hypothetical protein